MASLIKKGKDYSPESTVTSLLANCSLNNNSSSSNLRSSIQYKDKLYRSASQALEAYIEDFDQSYISKDIKPGKICLIENAPEDSRATKDVLKHKSVLKDFKQYGNRTHFRRKMAYDPDVVSLTTDDLLTFPADGSVSFTRTAILSPVSQRRRRNRKSMTEFASRIHRRVPSFGDEEEMNFHKKVSSVYRDSCRKEYLQHIYHKYDSDFSLKDRLNKKENFASASLMNYPRWLTSHKSDLAVSGISSVPDFEYPIWLKSHGLLSSFGEEGFARGDPVPLPDKRMPVKSQSTDISNNAGSCGSNILEGLLNKSDVRKNCLCEVPSGSCVPKVLKESQHHFIDDDAEFILQKAKRTLEMSIEELTSALKNNSSPCTADVLEAERSWDDVPIGLKSPVPVHCKDEDPQKTPNETIINGFLEDCLKNTGQESTFSGGNHHGPVEALKLMLFNLQAVQQNFTQNKTGGHSEELNKDSDEAVENNLCDFDMIPGTKSFQRAMDHLSRLKNLVEDTGGKKEAEDVIET